MDTKIEASRIVTKPLSGKQTVGAFVSKDLATGRKFYTPAVMGRPLRMAFHKKTLAELYATRIYNRYVRLLVAKRNEEKDGV